MCDCTEDDEEIRENDICPEMVTLFEPLQRVTCQKPYHSEKDIVEEIVCNAGINEKWKPDEIPLSESSNTICTPKQYTSSLEDSSGSSTSSRTYEFVRKCIRQYAEEEEGEGFSSIPKHSFEASTETEKVEEKNGDIECTLAIIKPEAIPYRKEIERRIFEEGFEIHQTRWLQLTPEQASEFYSKSYGELHFAHLVCYMSSSPIIVHVLAKENAVEDWRLIIGPSKVEEARIYFPDSIRGTYARKGEAFKNAVHGSVNSEEAEKEIHFFFPEMIIEPILSEEDATNYLDEAINPILVKALSMCCKLRPTDPILWLANWLLSNNPNKPRFPEDFFLEIDMRE